MLYFKLLEVFILSLLFNKNEYKLNHKNFKPLRFILIIVLVITSIIGIRAILNLHKLYTEVENQCPDILIKIKQEKNKTK